MANPGDTIDQKFENFPATMVATGRLSGFKAPLYSPPGNLGKLRRSHFVHFKGTVDTEFENAYSVVEVTKNRILVYDFKRGQMGLLGV